MSWNSAHELMKEKEKGRERGEKIEEKTNRSQREGQEVTTSYLGDRTAYMLGAKGNRCQPNFFSYQITDYACTL